MNIDNLMKTVEAGKPVSLKEAVLAMSKGYNDSLPSEEKISEELVILRAKLSELKGIMKDLNSGEAPEVLRKKKMSSNNSDNYFYLLLSLIYTRHLASA